MNFPNGKPSLDDDRLISTLTIGELQKIVIDAVHTAVADSHGAPTDKEILLTPEQAAELMGVNRQWLYRHVAKLPFARRISRKTLRFQEAGLRRWIAAKRPASRR